MDNTYLIINLVTAITIGFVFFLACICRSIRVHLEN